MSKTVNRLDDKSGLYAKSRSTGFQITTSGSSYLTSSTIQVTNAEESIVGDVIDVTTRYSLRLAPLTSNKVVVTLNSSDNLLIGDNSRMFSFNCKTKVTNTATFTCYLYIDGTSYTSVTPVVTTVYPGDIFSAVRSNVITLPIDSEDTYQLNVRIEISGHAVQPFYITSTNLIDDQMFYENAFVSSSRSLMPDFYWEMDSNQTNPTFPLFRLIDCLTASADDVYEEYKSIYPHSNLSIANTLEQITVNNINSTLVNPYYVNPKYAPWLSQFVGTKIKKNLYDESGEQYLPSAESERSFERWQLSTGYYGIASGSRSAIINAAKQALHFTKDGENSTYAVAVTLNYSGDPFAILVQTLVNETPDCAAEGEESYLVLQAVEPARPMGYSIFHEAKDEFEFTVNSDVLGVLGEGIIGTTGDGYDWEDGIIDHPEPGAG